MSENAKKEVKGVRRFLLPIAVAILGVLLLIFGSRSEQAQNEEESTVHLWEDGEMSAAAFAAETEEKIVSICSGVDGVGEVRAVVTLSGGYRAVYAADAQGSESSYRNETVLTGSGNSEKAILVGYEVPRIVGIGIVCTGGDDPAIRQSLTMLVSAAFDVSSNKIYVAGG